MFERVMVTGSTGFTGSHMLDLVVSKGCDIIGTKRINSPMINVKHLENKVKFINIELSNFKSVLNAVSSFNPDVIFHLASETFIPDSYKNPDKFVNANAKGTVNLLESVRKCDIDPVIHICSTSEVYGNVPRELQPITEETPLDPQNPYAVTKAAEDMFGEQYFESYGMKIVRSRAFSKTGPRKKEIFAESSFAKQIVLIERKIGSEIRVGNLSTERTFIDVRDAVKAYWLLAEKGKFGDVYNIGGDKPISMKSVLDILISFSNIPIKIVVDKNLFRPVDIDIQIPDSSKFRKLTGWKPEIPIEQSLKDLLEWWRSLI